MSTVPWPVQSDLIFPKGFLTWFVLDALQGGIFAPASSQQPLRIECEMELKAGPIC